VDDFRFLFAYAQSMFDPDANLPRINRGMVYLGACLIAGIRLARERQHNRWHSKQVGAIQKIVEDVSPKR